MTLIGKYLVLHLSLLTFCRTLENLKNGELISEDKVRELCFLAREILLEESNVQRVDAPVTVLYNAWLMHLLQTISRYVVIYMVNSMTLKSCLKLEGNVLKPTIYSLV